MKKVFKVSGIIIAVIAVLVLGLRTAAKRNHPVGTFGTVASVVSAAGSGTDINRNN